MTHQVKNPPIMQETQVRSLGQENPLEEEMATHSSLLAWRIPRTEEPGGLQSRGSQRVRHDWATRHSGTQHSVTVSVNHGLSSAVRAPLSFSFLLISLGPPYGSTESGSGSADLTLTCLCFWADWGLTDWGWPQPGSWWLAVCQREHWLSPVGSVILQQAGLGLASWRGRSPKESGCAQCLRGLGSEWACFPMCHIIWAKASHRGWEDSIPLWKEL